MSRWLLALPLAALVGLAALAGVQLFDGDRAGFERLARDAPDRDFARLDGGGAINFADPPGDEAIVVNLFASWCAPCEAEHPLLMRLSEAAPGRVYGVLYKDSEENGRAFLAGLGDPFTTVVVDPDGQGGLDFGLTGVPETFVVGPEGAIKLHVRGPLTPQVLDDIVEAMAAAR